MSKVILIIGYRRLDANKTRVGDIFDEKREKMN